MFRRFFIHQQNHKRLEISSDREWSPEEIRERFGPMYKEVSAEEYFYSERKRKNV